MKIRLLVDVDAYTLCEKLVAALSAPILVADDDDAFRSMLTEYLAGQGCQVLQATNGLEALLHVKHESPRAVIIDVTMPRLGGFDAVKRIRHFTPAVRIVIVTGNTDDPDIARAGTPLRRRVAHQAARSATA